MPLIFSIMARKSEQQGNVDLWYQSFIWLKALGNSVNKEFCKTEIAGHPDYPSLIALSDFLDMGGMRYKAVEGDSSHFGNFEYPLLAHMKVPGNEHLVVINDPSEWSTRENELLQWDGIVIFPEGKSKWQHPRNDDANRSQQTALLSGMSLCLACAFLFVFLNWSNSFDLRIVFGVLSFSGLLISLSVLAVEMGVRNEGLKQLCSVLSQGGCEKVTQSKYAKGILGFSLADAGVTYFAGQFIAYLISCRIAQVFQALAISSTLSFFVACYSIYLQAFRLKVWCVLCLGIVAVLLIQAGLVQNEWQNIVSVVPEAAYLGILIVLIAVYIPLKRLIMLQRDSKLKLVELRGWKFDGPLFVEQWVRQSIADVSIWEKDLVIGSEDAPLQITVACNPYCNPCAKAHTILDEMVEQYSSYLKVQVRLFFDNQNPLDKRFTAAKAILQKAKVSDRKGDLQQMLTGWFATMNYDKWRLDWPADPSTEVEDDMERHFNWIKASDISYTPTIFVNGKRLPARYSLSDLRNLVPQLLELLPLNAKPGL